MTNKDRISLDGAETLRLSQARDRLTRIWLVGVAVPTTLLVIQSILGKYGDGVHDVWSWFIPLVLPSIGLMVGVLGGAAFGGREHHLVYRTFYKVALWLSVFYLVLLAMTIILEPLSPLRGIALFGVSTYWLAPFQGLVVGALSYLFTSETSDLSHAVNAGAATTPSATESKQ